MAGAEVVERDGDADRAQAGEHVDRPLEVGDHGVLGDLELAGWSGSKPCSARSRSTSDGQAEVEQVGGPEVDRDAEVDAGAALSPISVQRAVEHEGGQRARQPALLDQRQEVPGAEQAALRVLPAHERLDAAHRARRAASAFGW